MSLDLSILGSLVPIFIVIVAGYIFRRTGFPGDDFWSYAERITYYVLFPALLLQKTATASLDMGTIAPMAAALYAAILAMAALSFLFRPWRRYGAKAFTSFFQGSIRINTYVGLSAAFALLGDKGLTLAAITVAVLIPLINVLCVTVLVVFGNERERSWRSLLLAIVRNPLIVSCTAGIVLNVSGIGLHNGVSETLLLFGRASLPLGLMALGAGLDLGAAKGAGTLMTLNCALKLIVMPFFMWTATEMLNVDATAGVIAVLFAALPGSPTSFILARQLGGDSLLMANIVTAQVVLSMVTLPFIMAMVIA